jgi:hypothetical protein
MQKRGGGKDEKLEQGAVRFQVDLLLVYEIIGIATE